MHNSYTDTHFEAPTLKNEQRPHMSSATELYCESQKSSKVNVLSLLIRKVSISKFETWDLKVREGPI